MGVKYLYLLYNMDTVFEKLNINKTPFTKKPKKQKVFNKVKSSVPPIANYNFEADLLYLPTTTKDKYKYLLVVVDLANDKFDIEPMKTRTAVACLNAYKEILKRKYIKFPEISIKTDNGGEFKETFNSYIKKHKILHLISYPHRHSQMANVESLNRQLGKLFALYMNQKELETGEEYIDWIDIIDPVRKELNEYREKKLPKYKDWIFPQFDPVKAGNPKYKIGDFVYQKLEVPYNALNNRVNDSKFREGDFRYGVVAKEIVKVLYMPDAPYYRYKLEGLNNVSYSENQLLPSTEKIKTYEVSKFINTKKVNKKTFYRVRWRGYNAKNDTWEEDKELIKDLGKAHFDKLVAQMK